MSEPDETLDGWLAEITPGIDAGCRQSRRFAPNSFGAGYDQGYYDALIAVQDKMAELWGAGDAVSSQKEPS